MKLRSTIPALAIAGLLVLAIDPAGVSAAAKNLVLGKANKTSATTTLQTTGNGPALSLKAKSGKPALAVNSTAKVAKLNADQVDGMDASALGTSATAWRLVVDQPTTTAGLTLPLDPGMYLVSYSAYLKNATNGTADCWIDQAIGMDETYVGQTSVEAGGSNPGLSATGVVEKTADGSITFSCSTDTAFTTFDTKPIQVVAVPLTSYTDGGTFTPVRPGH